MKNLALQRIQKMHSYNPPLVGRRALSGILLDFNERTVSPSIRVQKTIQQLLKSNTLQLYPEYGDLEDKLARYVSVNKNQILLTNGSDQAIDLVFRTFTKASDAVIIPSPSFSMFSQSACIAGNTIVQPLYTPDTMSFPTEEILTTIDESVKLIVICNPNNPTGTLVPPDDIEKIAGKAPGAIVLVDEAYFEFSRVTAIPLIKKYPNIIVVRTFSKAFALASLRIGYVVSSKENVMMLSKVRGPFDINAIAYTAALASLDDLKSVQKYARDVMDRSKPMVEQFFAKNGITFYQSAANFLLYRPTIEQETEILRKNGILVRPQDKTRIEGTLRLTIGTTKQMKKCITIYQNAILNQTEIKKYAFIDRDGTLIFEPQDTFQIDSLEKLRILDGVIKGLKALMKQRYELVMITNQDGLGTDSFPQKNFEIPQNKMLSIFKKNGIEFKRIFICPHKPPKYCGCRKPKIGLVKKFLRDNQMDKANSLVCGDRFTDNQFAKNLGIKFISMQTNGDFYIALSQGGVL